jgi:hypothetical protein
MFFSWILEHGETHYENMQNCVVLGKTKEGHKKDTLKWMLNKVWLGYLISPNLLESSRHQHEWPLI